MLLERYYDESLAQASYLIGCEQTRQAIVIDPNRDVERYFEAAEKRRMRIAYVTETHIHADYLSGALQLAAMSEAQGAHEGAELILSGHGGADWSYDFAEPAGARVVRDGDEIEVGKVKLRIMHTPGHTPEHISFLVTDTATGDRPIGLVSGDFLFVGDVGRPDLLEKAAGVSNTMERSARQLWESLERLRELPDYLQVWPGHGAGSACGKSLGAVPQTTIGYERLFNPALQQKTEEDFVRWVLADQPEPPPYFATMKQLNRDGPPELIPAMLPELSLTFVDAAFANRPWIIDLRKPSEFARGHYPKSINIPASRSLATYAGTVLTYDRPIILVARSEEQALGARRQLQLIGFDNITGWIRVSEIALSGGNEITPEIDARALADKLAKNGTRLIDVRGRSEWDHEHIAKAEHIYLGALTERMQDAPRGESITVICQSGSRSSIAASLLKSQGFKHVTNMPGGVDAWRRNRLPLVEENGS